MNVEEYFSKLNEESQRIFQSSMVYRRELGKAHHSSACLFEFASNLPDESERNLLETVSSQLESATFNACVGMYRQSFAALRLALELGLAAAHFSVHKLEHHEWLNGDMDIKWSSLVSPDDGVLSPKFAKAFFRPLSTEFVVYRQRALDVYRTLSEFVHGNHGTWKECGIKLEFKKEVIETYFVHFRTVTEIILIVLSCRYLRGFPEDTVDSLEFIPEEKKHIACLRKFLGGPEEIQ